MAVKIIIECNHPKPVAKVIDGDKEVFKSPLRVDLTEEIANQPLPGTDKSYQDRMRWESKVKNKVLKVLQKTLVNSRYTSGIIELTGLQEAISEN